MLGGLDCPLLAVFFERYLAVRGYHGGGIFLEGGGIDIGGKNRRDKNGE